MGPSIPTRPNVKLMERIVKDFGSYEKLEILQCEKHQNLTLWGCIPLLVIDMWEHSYFLQYKSNRSNYINAFWNILNWNVVNKRYEKISN